MSKPWPLFLISLFAFNSTCIFFSYIFFFWDSSLTYQTCFLGQKAIYILLEWISSVPLKIIPLSSFPSKFFSSLHCHYFNFPIPLLSLPLTSVSMAATARPKNGRLSWPPWRRQRASRSDRRRTRTRGRKNNRGRVEVDENKLRHDGERHDKRNGGDHLVRWHERDRLRHEEYVFTSSSASSRAPWPGSGKAAPGRTPCRMTVLVPPSACVLGIGPQDVAEERDVRHWGLGPVLTPWGRKGQEHREQ
jgi:hypothetical protein